MPASSLTGMKAPESPPTEEDAMMPPFFTWSFNRARAAVVPGQPTSSSPMLSRISAMESPTAGVGARERSTMPKGMPRRLLASWATNCPRRVTLKAVRLIVSHRVVKSAPLTDCRASLTTPGPETPTLMTTSPSVVPWKAPAMNGLSSGALQRATSFAQPRLSRSLVAMAVSLMTWPIRPTASMLMPVRVDPRLTEEQRCSVSARAWGMA